MHGLWRSHASAVFEFQFPNIAEQDYVQRVFKSYVADIDVDRKNIALALWEFGGTIVLH